MLFTRYLLAAELPSIAREEVGVLVVGAGVAGLTVACALGPRANVAVIAKGSSLPEGSTPYAQGGIAAAVGREDDPESHAKDTIAAGAGLTDHRAAEVLALEAKGAIEFLSEIGVGFDRRGDQGELLLGREGGHGRHRIVHAGGDSTGLRVAEALLQAAKGGGARVVPHAFLVDLVPLQDGIAALVSVASELRLIIASDVVLASGGAAQIYQGATAPLGCSGDGIAAALRAGAELQDMEFVQFHPTALALAPPEAPRRALITEALRGAGARLIDVEGRSVTEGVHPLGDLAPRDVVTRAISRRMRETKSDYVLLDAREVADLEKRFPVVLAACLEIGIDPRRDLIPVSPAAHFTIGGVRTDLVGRTSLEGLWAVGEVASTGVHGANRLASNSLLEGVVFGRRVAMALRGELDAKGPAGEEHEWMPLGEWPTRGSWGELGPQAAKLELRRRMLDHVGVARDGDGLRGVLDWLAGGIGSSVSQVDLELANMLQVSAVTAWAALRREESRGAHYRVDFPVSLERWRCRQILRRNSEGLLEVAESEVGPDRLT